MNGTWVLLFFAAVAASVAARACLPGTYGQVGHCLPCVHGHWCTGGGAPPRPHRACNLSTFALAPATPSSDRACAPCPYGTQRAANDADASACAASNFTSDKPARALLLLADAPVLGLTPDGTLADATLMFRDEDDVVLTFVTELVLDNATRAPMQNANTHFMTVRAVVEKPSGTPCWEARTVLLTLEAPDARLDGLRIPLSPLRDNDNAVLGRAGCFLQWCVLCCPPGFAMDDARGACTPCVAGETFMSATTSPLDVCLPVTPPCAAGFAETAAPTTSSNRECARCEAGTYAPGGAGSTCVACSESKVDHDRDPATSCQPRASIAPARSATHGLLRDATRDATRDAPSNVQAQHDALTVLSVLAFGFGATALWVAWRATQAARVKK